VTEVEALSADDVLGPTRAEIEELWRRVFPDTPDERFDEILPRHASREGFRFVAARSDDRLAGFAYGYRGGPGEWWHDRVAAAMTPDQCEEWLAPGHFEFVALQVAPELEGQGIGASLHDALLSDIGGTAVLSTQRSNDRARGFYVRRGWLTVVEDLRFDEGAEPFVVLGKHLG
jgi:ribosomal protein S18 acetylase RimI-like enzyme